MMLIAGDPQSYPSYRDIAHSIAGSKRRFHLL